MNPRLLLVEDEVTLSLLLKERFEREGFQVKACADGKQGLAQALKGDFDILILDIKLPGRNGFEICHDVRRHGINIPVLMLTARGDVKDRVKGLNLGADDYLPKPFEVSELLARIGALLRRAKISAPQLVSSVFCFGNVAVDTSNGEVLRDGSPVQLTAREFELLNYLISHPDVRISREVLLREVWGYPQTPNTRSVDVHIGHLRQKLEANPRAPRHFTTAYGSGYKFVPFP